jgi:hypothetical protein
MRVVEWVARDVQQTRDRMLNAVCARVPTSEWSRTWSGRAARQQGASLNHLLLHTVRHHDLAVNTAIRNRAPLYFDHRDALGAGGAGAEAGLAEREDRALTEALPADALVAYLAATYDTTLRWLSRLGEMVLDSVPATGRRLATKAAVDPHEYEWLYGIWEGRTVGDLLQWQVVGHSHNHVGEMIALRNRLGRSPH